MTPMKVLGGRSPYEVVTGLKSRLPAALDARAQVEFVTMDEYASRLRASRKHMSRLNVFNKLPLMKLNVKPVVI